MLFFIPEKTDADSACARYLVRLLRHSFTVTYPHWCYTGEVVKEGIASFWVLY